MGIRKEIEEVLKLSPLYIKNFKKFGYDKEIYYAGDYDHEKQYTKIKKHFHKLGIPFPFNIACFKHDYLYSMKPTLFEKCFIDIQFYNDMIIILNKRRSTNKKINKWYYHLRFRARIYYFIVFLTTPIYLIKGKIKFK